MGFGFTQSENSGVWEHEVKETEAVADPESARAIDRLMSFFCWVKKYILK